MSENTKIKTEHTIQKIEEHKILGIEKLNDDCLILIFESLSIADKIKIERVCKRWRYLSKQSWRKFKNFNFRFDTWGFSKEQNVQIDCMVIEKIINLSGNYLTSLTVDLHTFKKIIPFCNNIQELYIYDILSPRDLSKKKSLVENQYFFYPRINCQCKSRNDWEEIIQLLERYGQHLFFVTKFNLQLHQNFCKEEDFAKLLTSMKSLKSFYLSNCDMIGKNCNYLDHLSFDTIEEIHLDFNVETDLISNSIFSSITKKCKKLRKICVEKINEVRLDLIFDVS